MNLLPYDFLAQDCDLNRGGDAQLDLAAADLQHLHLNVFFDVDALSQFSCQNQHDPSLALNFLQPLQGTATRFEKAALSKQGL
jgi:hypothetical protein